MQSVPRPQLFTIAWPLFVELALGIGMGFVGLALAAHSSDHASAAFALTNHVAGTLFFLFRIIGAGTSVVITQHIGALRLTTANDTARTALAASTWMGLLCAGLALLGSPLFMRLMQAPIEVAEIATPFLQALAASMLLDAWLATQASVLRAHLHARATLVAIVVMHLTHLALAIPLVLGAGPIPALGLPGYALALFISRAIGIALNLWFWQRYLALTTQVADWWRVQRATLANILHIGLPGAGENVAYRLCFMVSVAVAGQLGAASLAAQSYALQVMYAILLFSLATGLATEILVGHLIGSGKLREAQQLVLRTVLLGLAVSTLVAASVALVSPWVFARFTSDATIIAQCTTLMWCAVILEPGRVFNLVVINALRAAGDACYPVMIGAVSMVLVLAGGSWLLGVHLGLGLLGVWIAYAADEWVRGLLMWRRWLRQDWVPQARAMHRRLKVCVDVGVSAGSSGALPTESL